MQFNERSTMCRWLSVFVAVFACAAPAAAQVTWDGGAKTSSWHDAANWEPDGVPGPLDDVAINGASVVVSKGMQQVASLEVASNASLRIEGGTLGASGAFTMFGTLDYAGGTIDSTPLLDDGDLIIAPTATPAQFILVDSCTVVGDIGSGHVLWVQGNAQTGHAELQTTDGLVNQGTILLEAIDGNYTSELFVPSGTTFTNAVDGVVTTAASSGGTPRFDVDGTFINDGLIDIATNSDGIGSTNGLLVNHGTIHTAGGVEFVCNIAQIEQVSGTLDAEGPMRFTGNLFTLIGGTLDGQIIADDVDIDIRPTVSQTTTLLVHDNCELLAMDSPLVTLWVQGNAETSTATLHTIDGLVNHGTILLESIDGNYTSELQVTTGTTFTNGLDGTIRVGEGSGGQRTLDVNGEFLNEGTVDPGYPASLDVHGDYVQSENGRLYTEFAGPNVGEYSSMNVSGHAQLAGTVVLSRIEEYIPDITDAHSIIEANSISGAFQVFSTCDDVSVDYTAEFVDVYFDVSDIVGDVNNSGFVDVSDLLILLAGWGTCPVDGDACCPADLNGDGVVDVTDLLLLLANWG